MRSKMARWLVAAMLLALTAVPALAAGRGWLGVTTQSTDEDLRRGLDLTRDGLLVNQVSEASPADRAGLRKGDVILTYNSRTVTEPEDLRQLVRDTEPGSSASLGIWRDGRRRTLDVTVGELPDSESDDRSFEAPVPPTPRAPRAPSAPRAPRDSDDPDHGDIHRRVIIDGREIPQDEIDEKLKDMKIKIDGLDDMKDFKGFKGMRGWSDGPGGSSMFFAPSMGRGRLGVRVEKLNDDLGQALGAEGDKGVLVVEVLEDTPAQKAGLRAGDVIVRVGEDDVDSPDELVKALGSRDGKVDIRVLRKGSSRSVEADLGSRSQTRDFGPRDRSLRGNMLPRNTEPGQGMRGYRGQDKDESGSEADLREEIRQLKRELRELRQQLDEKK